jgi:adenine-specific DNA-methyltransferase
MPNHTKLELTWIGKENRPRLEPRILLEDPELSYHARHRVSDSDIFDNRLIFGDNLLALKALEQEFAGKIKCIYIDPPFNIPDVSEYYEDGVEHSTWLSLIRDRLELLSRLLHQEGTIFVHIDDVELGYLIVLLDEVFGRDNRVSVITFKQGSATGHKAINPGCVSTSNFVLMYVRDKSKWKCNRVYTARERDKRYTKIIENKEDPYQQWRFVPLTQALAREGRIDVKTLRKKAEFESLLSDFVLQNADRVIRTARPNYDGVGAQVRAMIDRSVAKPSRIFLLERDGHSNMYFIGGERILFYSDKLKMIDGKYVSGEPLTTIWDDILSNNLHKEGGVHFPKGKKPEGLIKRVFDLSTEPGDWVLDSFAGSGTTGAVAHKMGRRWIMVELGEHCHTHIIPRLRKVIDGEDQGGISKAVDWKGGGGFRYYRLAPSLLQKDKWGNLIINKEYNAEMLAEAMCKHLNFEFDPSDAVYWQHGRSTESDFIYITTQTLSRNQLAQISEEVGEQRTLLICCTAFRANQDEFHNLTIKKIPKAVLNKCEYGRDDYSLQISVLPPAPSEVGKEVQSSNDGKRTKLDTGTMNLFDDEVGV